MHRAPCPGANCMHVLHSLSIFMLTSYRPLLPAAVAASASAFESPIPPQHQIRSDFIFREALMASHRFGKPQLSFQLAIAPQLSAQVHVDGKSLRVLDGGTSGSHTLSQLPCLLAITAICVGFIVVASVSLVKFSLATSVHPYELSADPGGKRYLYWGYGVDCPGKNCLVCGGLGHQESSLRCALEEAVSLNRTFVLPSRLCLAKKHNSKLALGPSPTPSLDQQWDAQSCPIESIYDIELLSKTIPVILDSSAEWQNVVRLANRGLLREVRVQNTKSEELEAFERMTIINRTANPLAWFMECKNRHHHGSLTIPYSMLGDMAAQSLREVADKIKQQLGDYDAIHVRRGDKLKLKKDRFGVYRTTYPHLDRDTQPQAILNRIKDWIAEGRTLYIASDEKKPGFFDPISERYRVLRSTNFTTLLEPVVHNNYQLFMIDRLILAGARVLVKTWKEDPTDLSLTDDLKKALKRWEIPVYTFNDSSDAELSSRQAALQGRGFF